MKKRQSAGSKEFVEAIVFADADPTLNAVQWAFPVEDVVPSVFVAGDWRPGSWDGQKAVARCLVGPGGGVITLAASEIPYDAYVKWTESPEVPLILAGQVEIY